MKVSPENLRRQYRIIYESLVENPRIYFQDLVPLMGLSNKIVAKRMKDATVLLYVVGPEVRKMSFGNLTEYMYFIRCKDPDVVYQKYRKDQRVIYLVKTLGFCDLWIITREKIKIDGEIVIGGPRSDFYVSKAPDRSWEDALKIMRKKVEKFKPKTYRRKGLIQTHWDEMVRWDEKDELLYRYFKYDLRKPYDPALRNDQVTEWKFHDFLSKLPQFCTIFTQYYPEGLLSYDPYLFKMETDYEDFIVGLFSEMPTTSSFFKVSDRLFVHIHVPKEYIRNTDPEASTTKEYIPLLIRTLIEKGIIKEETHAMCQYHWRKDL